MASVTVWLEHVGIVAVFALVLVKQIGLPVRVLVLAKFIPGLGAVATAMSGVVAASLVGFVFYDAIGATLWTASGVAIGALFHDAIDGVFAELATLGRVGGLLLVGLLGVFLALKAWRRHVFFQQLRMDRISVAELFQRLRDGPALLVVDARSHASRLREGMIPGAIALETLLEDTEPKSHRGEAVVYCACPNEATSARFARKLMSMGFKPVRPLAGGVHAWQDAGFVLALATVQVVTGPQRAESA